MEHVREIGAGEAEIDEYAVVTARQALAGEMAAAGRTARDRRTPRTWAGVGIGGLIAGVAGAAIVAGSVLAPPSAQSASAAEVLEKAAESTATSSVLDPAPGQYIRIMETAVQGWRWAPDAAVPGGGWWEPGDGDTTARLETTSSLYVPADRSGEWVQTWGENHRVLEVKGPDADAASAAIEDQLVRPEIERLPGGRFVDPLDPDAVPSSPRNPLECYYDVMPRDPSALLAWLKAFSADDVPEGCSAPTLGDPIGFDLAPADLRSTMFRTLSMIAGAKIVRVEGDITTISFPGSDPFEGLGEGAWFETIMVDTAQGVIVGRGDPDDVDAGGWTSGISVSVVDEAP